MLKIRRRERRGHCKEAGGYRGWTEYQVVDGRKIVRRFDMRSQAETFIRVDRMDQSTLMGPPSDFD